MLILIFLLSKQNLFLRHWRESMQTPRIHWHMGNSNGYDQCNVWDAAFMSKRWNYCLEPTCERRQCKQRQFKWYQTECVLPCGLQHRHLLFFARRWHRCRSLDPWIHVNPCELQACWAEVKYAKCQVQKSFFQMYLVFWPKGLSPLTDSHWATSLS